MPHLRTLDEIPSEELVTELKNRERRLKNGRCPYCNQPLSKSKHGDDFENCRCRFGNLEVYHPDGILKPLQ